MNIEQAKKINLKDFLCELGFNHVRQRGNNYWYLSPFRDERTASFKVNTTRNEWFDFGINEGGGIIQLAKFLYHTNDIPELLRRIAEKAPACTRVTLTSRSQQRETVPYCMVEVIPLSNEALLSYLSSRRIDFHAARSECVEIHYVLYNKPYYSIGFSNMSGGYEIRNPYFKGCMGEKNISRITATPDNTALFCCVFEGFMDYLSYLTFLKQHDSPICIRHPTDYIILNSVNNIAKVQHFLDEYEHIHCYLDNDQAGRVATEYILGIQQGKASDESWRYSDYKDLNDCLREKKRFQQPNILPISKI